MISQLQKYINGTMSYFEACSVFNLVAKNKCLSRNLLRSDSKANRAKLEYEIGKLMKDHNIEIEYLEEIEVIEPKSHYVPFIPTNPPQFAPDSKTGSIKDKILEARQKAYSKRGHLHGGLHVASTDEQRLAIAKQLVELQPKIDVFNTELRQIEKGEIPTKYLKTDATAADFIKARNLKQYIARDTKKLENASPEQRKRIEALIEQHHKKLGEL